MKRETTIKDVFLRSARVYAGAAIGLAVYSGYQAFLFIDGRADGKMWAMTALASAGTLVLSKALMYASRKSRR